jgi:hypothetical protein
MPVERLDFNRFSRSDAPNEHNEKPLRFVPERLFSTLNCGLSIQLVSSVTAFVASFAMLVKDATSFSIVSAS